jgi:hypothetical protein
MPDAMTMPIENPKRPQFTPDEAWIDAFATQNTSALREAARRYAARRLHRVGKSVSTDELDIRALVQDALTDTLFGEVAWDPAAKTLEQHVLDTLRWRTRDVRKRARKFRHERIDVFDEDTEGSATMAASRARCVLIARVRRPTSLSSPRKCSHGCASSLRVTSTPCA